MSVQNKHVIRQCLHLLPLQDLVAWVLDYRKKLTTANLLKLFITGQLLHAKSLGSLEMYVRSEEQFQEEFGISSISKSQLSRRINDVPTEITQALFHAVMEKMKAAGPQPESFKWGKPLALVDSTNIHLPFKFGDWAYVSKHDSRIKVHTRLLVLDKDTHIPDRIVPSTGNVSDFEGSDPLVVDLGVIYVMDRGYVSYLRMEKWVSNDLDFVMRISNHHHAKIVEEHALPETPSFIQRDAAVLMGNQKTSMSSELRLIEFTDEQGRFYRLLTTCWKLDAVEIANIYRQRWLIELFFKWIKQHLKVAKLYSCQPEAVWNHIFLAIVAYALPYLVKVGTRTKESAWRVLELIRIYAMKPWHAFEKELLRKPSKPSRGRQKKDPPQPITVHASDVAIVKQPRKRRER